MKKKKHKEIIALALIAFLGHARAALPDIQGTWSNCFTDQGSSSKMQITVSGTSITATHAYFEGSTTCSGGATTSFLLTGTITDTSRTVNIGGNTLKVLTFTQSNFKITTITTYVPLWKQLTGTSMIPDTPTSIAGGQLVNHQTFANNGSTLYEAFIINPENTPQEIRFTSRAAIPLDTPYYYYPIGRASLSDLVSISKNSLKKQ